MSGPTRVVAAGHYDGDGCTFPNPGHLVPAYRSHLVWDDESGDRYFIDGHVTPERRAIAAVNHWTRDTCGLVNLADDKSHSLDDVSVSYAWMRPNPQHPGDDETGAWCREDHPEAKPITVVSLLR